MEYHDFVDREGSLSKLKTVSLDNGISIPISVFLEGISPLESVIKYLKDTLHYRISEIAEILARSSSTVSTSYYNSIKKIGQSPKFDAGKESVPVNIFKEGDLSVMESVCLFLKQKGEDNLSISAKLQRDPRTIWTYINRGKIKLRDNDTEE